MTRYEIDLMRRSALRGLLLAACLVLPEAAFALSFGPFPITYPSAVTISDAIFDINRGSLTLEVDLPITSPQLLRITSASIEFRTSAVDVFSFALDPSVPSAALGVVQPDGSFEIPTLFLRGSDGQDEFDLAVPNVTGLISHTASLAYGLTTVFSVETPLGQRATVAAFFGVPEPGTALLLLLGLGVLAAKEIAR